MFTAIICDVIYVAAELLPPYPIDLYLLVVFQWFW